MRRKGREEETVPGSTIRWSDGIAYVHSGGQKHVWSSAGVNSESTRVHVHATGVRKRKKGGSTG